MTDASAGEIVIHQLDAHALLPRRVRGSSEPLDARLLRTIAAALPEDVLRVIQNPADHDARAHMRAPMDMMRQG